ncbi:MAG: peptide chain release factor N(5)-glutamine methyltransferase [Clostridia bacterium]|nr:peptide chain release factor N(5)-glutamine methyltransferase [Clostridia bacterium]
MKIKDVLLNGISILKDNKIEDSNLKARVVLADLLGKNKEYLMIHGDEKIEEGLNKIFLDKIERLKNNEPLQYVINKQEFMGFEFYVDKNVLIPQPDTENLVEEIIYLSEKIRKNDKKELRILDMCTGSGAIAISTSKLIENSLVYASDISKKALKIAEENSSKNQANVLFFESDLFKKISELYKFDIIVSNPPYIETDTIKTLSEEVKNEPMLALDGGKDGLDFYRKISKDAKKYLDEGGYLAFEIGYNQKLDVENLLKENGYKNIYSRKDLSGNDRIVVGQV